MNLQQRDNERKEIQAMLNQMYAQQPSQEYWQGQMQQPSYDAQPQWNPWEQLPQEETPVQSEPSIESKPESKPSIDSKPSSPPIWKDLLSLVLKIGSIVLTFVLLFTFLFGVVRFQEPSMAPAIKDGDLVLFYRYTKSGYEPQDVIALEYNGKKHIRRVIATAGDTVDITQEGLVINGALQQEMGIYQKTERYQSDVNFPLTVPEGEVFVMGDARTNTTDSRIYGCVKIKDTLGKVMTVIRRRGI